MVLRRLRDLKVGDAEQFVVQVTTADVEAFARLSGDTAPLHTDAAFARSQGHAGTVAHGVLLAAYASRFIGVHLPGDLGILRRLEFDFRHPVVPPEAITVRGEVTQISEGTGQVTIQLRLTRSDGTVAATAKAQSVLRDRTDGQ